MGPDAAAGQIALWRSAGLRTALLTAPVGSLDKTALSALRAQCDRLVLGVADASEAEDGQHLAQAAAIDALDLVCDLSGSSLAEAVGLLRPDLWLNEAGRAAATTQ
jgi:hypothetical protein